jgi:ABC-type enterobactin transport system permease subunit
MKRGTIRPMLTLSRTALGILWSLWFGGIISVFLFATTLFNGLGRESAAIATGVMFPAFERYALVLAALSLAATVAWRALSHSRAATWTFAFLAAATLALVISAAVITPRILHLRAIGETHSPDFARAHGISGVLYVIESLGLLAAGITFLTAGRTRIEPPPASNPQIPA